MLDLNGHTKIAVENDILLVDGYKNTDPAVVSHIQRIPANERALELDRCLTVGVRVLEVASPVLDATFVEGEFAKTVDRLRQVVDEAKEAVSAKLISSLNPLVGDGGSLQATLGKTTETIERELRKYCDEESARSISNTVARKMEEHLRASERRVERALAEALDVTQENSAINRILKVIQAGFSTSMSQLNDLAAKVSGIVERRDEREGSTKKGADFEDAVFEEVAHIARINGDSAEATGRTKGEGGKMRGDYVITVDPAITGGAEVRLAAEAMDRANVSQNAALKELNEAKENRAAAAAIAILSSRQIPAACGQVLQRHPGNRYICVVDKESWDLLALEVAYWAARVDALREVGAASAEEVDLTAAASLIEEAIGHLADLGKLRAKLSAGRGAITDAEGLLSDIEGKLTRCLSKVAAVLTGVTGGP